MPPFYIPPLKRAPRRHKARLVYLAAAATYSGIALLSLSLRPVKTLSLATAIFCLLVSIFFMRAAYRD